MSNVNESAKKVQEDTEQSNDKVKESKPDLKSFMNDFNKRFGKVLEKKK